MKKINQFTYALLISSVLAVDVEEHMQNKAITNDFFKYMGNFGSKLALMSLEK